MSARMTLRERVTTALKGGMPDRIPFTCYLELYPEGAAGKQLQDLGLAVLSRSRPYGVRRERVKVETRKIRYERYPAVHNIYETPIGTLTQIQVVDPAYGSLWTKEHFIKRPEDYAVFEFIIRDEVFEPDIDGFLEHDRSFGDYGLAIPRAADPPMQLLWRRFSGLERFSYDWFDCRDEVERALGAIRDRNERIWKIVAELPGELSCSGGNLSGDMVGPPMFKELILPHFEREAEIMHGVGKRTMNHMDGMLKSLVNSVAECPVDIVEAFNPAPDGNVTLAEVRKAWPGKTVSINFPSSVHIRSEESIKQMTMELLRHAAPGQAFNMGITEDVPIHVIVQSLSVIAKTLNEHGKCPLDLEALA